MFLNITALKKILTNSYKSTGLTVGRLHHQLICLLYTSNSNVCAKLKRFRNQIICSNYINKNNNSYKDNCIAFRAFIITFFCMCQ